MDSLWPTLVPTIVAVVAAVLAFLSARDARASANTIDRRRHEIEHHDALTETFRSPYADFMRAVPLGGVVSKDAGLFLASGEILSTHPLTTEALAELIGRAVNNMGRFLASGKMASDMNDTMNAINVESRAIQRACSDRRLELLDH